jgi:FkbM family methyltransferase
MTPKSFARAARDMMRYQYHLKNGASVWLRKKFQRPLPPFKFRNGYVWHHGPRDQPIMLFQEIFIDRFYEPLEAPPNAIVFDVGANIGAVTLYWAVDRPDIRFHAYEPNPESFVTLKKNIEANRISSQLAAYNEAIGRSRGQVDLWIDVPTALSTSYGEPPAEGARKISVPAITLDDAWERAGRSSIWMLKIDTEGAEGDILEAASDAMLDSVQKACIEWHDNIVPGVYARCVARLKAAGFKYHERFHPWNEGIIFASK